MAIKIKEIQQPVKAESPTTRCLGVEQITSLSSAVALKVPFGCRRAIVQVLTQGIYFVEDGSTPSSTNGLEAEAGDVLEYLDADYGAVLPKWRVVEKTASAKLNIFYYD